MAIRRPEPTPVEPKFAIDEKPVHLSREAPDPGPNPFHKDPDVTIWMRLQVWLDGAITSVEHGIEAVTGYAGSLEGLRNVRTTVAALLTLAVTVLAGVNVDIGLTTAAIDTVASGVQLLFGAYVAFFARDKEGPKRPSLKTRIMAQGEHGIQQTREVANAVAAIVRAVQASLANDGQFTVADVGNFIGVVGPIVTAIGGIDEVPDELLDLSDEEIAELLAEVTTELGVDPAYGKIARGVITAISGVLELVNDTDD